MVLQRDGYRCVAPLISAERGLRLDPCRDKWGNITDRPISLTLDHVNEAYGRMGKAADGDPDHLVTLCYHHHLNGWATAHRRELRVYLSNLSR